MFKYIVWGKGFRMSAEHMERYESREQVVRTMRRQRELSGTDPSGLDLSGIKLTGLSLEGADLSNANLQGATLAAANMAGVDLSGARLNGARVVAANPGGARDHRRPRQWRGLVAGRAASG